MSNAPHRKKVYPPEVYEKLEKVWREEGLSAALLEERFGISKYIIQKFLRGKKR